MRVFSVSKQDPNQFTVEQRPDPTPEGRDILVRVEAISVNPVDGKVRKGRAGRVLGWDASGVVVSCGPDVTRFSPGDAVFYAGDIRRDGTNAELHLVDERLVGHKPSSLTHAQAAALPLTAITAWEGLHEQLRARAGGTLLVINSAGGAGSMVLQLARDLGMTTIGTASRPETIAWSKQMGADHVINHRHDMPAQLKALGFDGVDFIFCCYDTAQHFDAMAEVINPQGRIVSIVETDALLPLGRLFSKRVTFAWELMFTRSAHQTDDMAEQGAILDRVSALVDEGRLSTTLREDGGVLSAEKLAAAHQRLSAGTLIGKLVFSMR